MSKCVYLASMGVQIRPCRWRSKSRVFIFFFFSKCISDGHANRNKENIAKMYAFVHRNIMVYTENKKRLIWLQVLSYLSFRETFRHNHRYHLASIGSVVSEEMFENVNNIPTDDGSLPIL